MPARLITGHPKIEETRNQLAVMRGPLLYALEGVDLTEKVSVEEIVLPTDIAFTPVHKPDLLNGVTLLKGTAQYVAQPNWKHTLYREWKNPTIQDIEITLIPYYTWANRGTSKMSVWLPSDYKD